MADEGGHGDVDRVYLSGGKGPPKPPPKAAIGLTEVERAISVLEGRHPEHEKLRRETRAGIEQRRGEIEVELARKSRARRLRAAALVSATLVAGVVAFFAWRLVARTRGLQAALDEAEAPWLARGFTSVASNLLTAGKTLDADLSGAGCFVGLAATDAPLRANVGGAPVVAPRSIAWCACGPGHVSLEAPPTSAPVGLAVMRIDAAALGGPFARSWVDFTPGAWDDSGRDCADATLDAWIDGHHLPHVEPDAAWLESDPSRAALRRAGLKVVAAVESTHPFGLVDLPAGSCALAIARAEEPLSLRATGGERLLSGARGALAWCGSTPATLTVWREGASPVAILVGPAARIGGRLGVRETAEAAGVSLTATAVGLRSADLAWNAAALLTASAFANVDPWPLGTEPGPLDGRTVALALTPGATAVWGPERVVVACDPPLAKATPSEAASFDSVCAPAAPIAWFNKKDAPIGAARGMLPVWLSPLEGRHEADAVARIPELLALTRRLAREGFEATSLEGVTELPDGVRIIGRAAEDAVVAIGLAPRPPWALPYSNSVPWDLGDAPRVVPLKPGETVKLVSSPPPTAPLNTRRTVVFRRSVSAPL
jgi:hypothetical protein